MLRLQVQLAIAALAVLTALAWLWLWLMVRRPDRWSRIVDKENAFWASRGVVSPARAERIGRLEKGRFQKVMVGAIAALGTSLLLMIALVLVVLRR